MSFHNWLQVFRSAVASGQGPRNSGRRGPRRVAPSRLRFESLEDRRVFAFGSPVDYVTGAAGLVAVVTADFDNDGHLDLATANARSDTVSVLLGSANGTFGPVITSAAGVRPRSIAVGDFDNDGNLDLAGVSESTNPFVTVMFGNGNGNFLSPSYISLGRLATPLSEPLSEPMSVAVGDFDEDHLMDIAVAGTYNTHYPGYCCGGADTRVQVILAHDDRTFSAPEVAFQSFSGGPGVISPLVVTDFNGDDHQDALVGFDGEYVRILLGDGEGNLASASNIDWNIRQGGGMAAGDVNVDGIADLIAADNANVNVRLGNGAGGFEPPPYGLSYVAGDGVTTVVLGDFDRDGALDVATVNYGSNDVSILRGHGDGTFAPPEHFAAGLGAISIAAGDFNGDGWLDVATANAIGNNVSVLLNNQSWGAPPPLVSVSDATVTEGNTGTVNATFTLILSRAADVEVTVRFDTANTTAAAGSDYNAASGTVIIPAGQLSRTFTVAVKGDRLGEPTETFAVNLSAATNATIGDGQGIGTIVDNEPRISITDFTKAEGKLGTTTLFTFTVRLSAAYDQAVAVNYATADGTAKTGDNDYLAKSGTLTFKPGQTNKTITIKVRGDSKREPHETFFIRLANAVNSYLEDAEALATILNDD